MKKLLHIIYLLIVPLLLFLNIQPAFALVPSQRLEIERRAWLDPTDCYPGGTGKTQTPTQTGGGVTSGKVYLLGDSIIAGNKDAVIKGFTDAGFGPVEVNALGSRNLSGTPPSPDGVTAFTSDKAVWKDAKAIVIELGTNTGGFTKENMQTITDQIKTENPSAKVYWVTSFRTDTADKNAGLNKIVSDNAGTLGYSVIDWFGVVKDHASEYLQDNAHPNNTGLTQFINTLVGGVKSGGVATNPSLNLPTNNVCCSNISTGSSSNGHTPVPDSDNVKTAWKYLTDQGLTGAEAAGIIGNLQQESGFNLDPNALNSIGAFGIAQWLAGRKDNLMKLPDYKSLNTQLQFLWSEIPDQRSVTTKKNYFESINDNMTPSDAAVAWEDTFERSGGSQVERRKANAEAVFKTLGPGPTHATIKTGTGSVSGGSAGCSGTSVGGGGSGSAKIIAVAQAEQATGCDEASGCYHKYTMGRDEAWCADFVSWVLKEAGVPFTGGNEGWNIPSVQSVQAYFEKIGTWHARGSGYTPQPGDVVVYNEGQDPYPQHVNIVIEVNGKGMTTIGGNEGNKVSKNTHNSFEASYITGFGTPKAP